MEEIDIVIVGGGICGLATALALHRKGIKSVVLERAEKLRTTGAGITILPNGWRALQQLGLASELRLTALPLLGLRDISLTHGKQLGAPLLPFSDLIKALAHHLPSATIRYGCQLISLQLDPLTSYPLLRFHDGTTIRAKVLIGCDGVNSIVGDFLGLKQKKIFGQLAARGFTEYPDGHGLPAELIRMRSNNTLAGAVPVTDHLVFWFAVHKWNSTVAQDPKLIQQMTVDALMNEDFPVEKVEMVKMCELSSLSLTHLKYRSPWEVLTGKFRRGTVIVAGDAMHVMGPFLGQGGSAAMEDAVVVARCLANKHNSKKKTEEALEEYIKERRKRLVQLSTQAYLFGSSLDTSSSSIKKFLIIVSMILLFSNPIAHIQYDCGPL